MIKLRMTLAFLVLVSASCGPPHQSPATPQLPPTLERTIVLQAIRPTTGAQAPLRRTRTKRWIEDVEVLVAGTWRNATRFTDPNEIEFAAVAPSGARLAVWHKPTRHCLQLALYELPSLRLVQRFAPGYGGSLEWTAYDTLLHQWGAGSGCSDYAIYDSNGEELSGGVRTGWALTPSRTHLLLYPSGSCDYRTIRALDLATGRCVYEVDSARLVSSIVVGFDDSVDGSALVLTSFDEESARHVVLRYSVEVADGPAGRSGD